MMYKRDDLNLSIPFPIYTALSFAWWLSVLVCISFFMTIALLVARSRFSWAVRFTFYVLIDNHLL